MIVSRIHVWGRWAILVFALWSVWGFVVRPFFVKRLDAAGQRQSDCDRQLAATKADIAHAPALLHQVDSCRHNLDSCLASFAGSRDIDKLTSQLRAAGERRGLGTLQVDPDLRCVLNASRSMGSAGFMPVRLDTLVISLGARGRFFDLGAWLDDIERRPDFRTWVSCRWTRGDDGRDVGFEGKAILLVMNRSEQSNGSNAGGT